MGWGWGWVKIIRIKAVLCSTGLELELSLAIMLSLPNLAEVRIGTELGNKFDSSSSSKRKVGDREMNKVATNFVASQPPNGVPTAMQ